MFPLVSVPPGLVRVSPVMWAPVWYGSPSLLWGLAMAKDRRTKVHLYQADHGLALCGREVDGLGPMVAENVLEVTCDACAAELRRLIGQSNVLREARRPQTLA